MAGPLSEVRVIELGQVIAGPSAVSGRNQNITADEAMRMAGDVVDAARGRGLYTTITLATAFGCPFEGEVEPARVAEFARRCAESGSPTGIDLKTLLPTAEFLGEQLGHEVPALVPRAVTFP